MHARVPYPPHIGPSNAPAYPIPGYPAAAAIRQQQYQQRVKAEHVDERVRLVHRALPWLLLLPVATVLVPSTLKLSTLSPAGETTSQMKASWH